MTSEERVVQPRYAAYCAAHHKTPDEMLAHDAQAWPGGSMCGFILWIGSKWESWGALVGGKPKILSQEHHSQFDSWLKGGAS